MRSKIAKAIDVQWTDKNIKYELHGVGIGDVFNKERDQNEQNFTFLGRNRSIYQNSNG